ncbi:hypothetical protein Plhal304r1_c057g0143011 [Plasmopara halstedii]
MAQKTASSRRPPRSNVNKVARATWLTIDSPYAAPVRVRAGNSEQCDRPKLISRQERPYSASQVASTTSSRLTQPSLRPSSARRQRPISASRARYMQVESIAFPLQNSFLNSHEGCISPSPEKSEIQILHEVDSTAMQVKLHALLEMWDEDQLTFRSTALFCEAMFKQAVALTRTMPRPNAFVSAVAFTGLAQMGTVFAKEHPSLLQMIDEVGTAMYSNFLDFQHFENLETHRSSLFYQRGKPWFQDMMRQKMQCDCLQNSVICLQNEVDKLQERLQEVLRDKLNVAATPATAHASSQCDNCDEYSTSSVFPLENLSLKSQTDEIVKAFSRISDVDAQHVLSILLEKAVDRDLTMLPETLAVTIGEMEEQHRQKFLRECFDYVTTSELHDAIQERDDLNDDTCHQSFVENLSNLLQTQVDSETSIEVESSSSVNGDVAQSEEDRIGKRVHELMELVEDVATEVSSFKSIHRPLLSDSVLERLSKFENPTKRPKKEQQDEGQEIECECTCGRHILLDDGESKEDEFSFEASVDTDIFNDEDIKKYRPRRKSTLMRPMSASLGRRKNAISFNPRADLTRRSSDAFHVFPLAEVCHLLSAILHLQFSRDASELVNASNATSLFDERFGFLKQGAGPMSFKALAKDFLTRKYGIKSIAVMHTMQLERSLLHYSTKDSHVRCTLFSWFFGSDTTRTQSKNYAFFFYQKFLKCLINLIALKKKSRSNSIASLSVSGTSQPLAYGTLITMWNGYIGDGEPMKSRTIPTFLALETCKQTFPRSMQRTGEFTSFREKLFRHNLSDKSIELELFLHMTMTAWQQIFDIQMQEVSKTIAEMVGVLDLDGFEQCLSANGLDFTTGERYELFDLLTLEGDESVVESKKMIQLVMEAKYLNPLRL